MVMQYAVPAVPTVPSPISTFAGFNVLLEGEAGTGKTYSIGTLVDSGLKVSYLALESGIESLMGYWADAGKPIPPNLSWHVLSPAQASLDEMITTATNINTMTFQALCLIKDPNRNLHNQFIEFLKILNNFTDQRTGEILGPVNKWSNDRVLVIDGLTGIGLAAMSLVVGGKPTRDEKDYGMAMEQIERILRMLTDGCKCHFVLIAHVEKELDQVLGGTHITMATLGRKLAPKIPPMFSDVIFTYREGKNFYWSTERNNVVTKIRNLPLNDKIDAKFGPIVEKWTARKKESEK
jgi:hypothetical protein